jgi:hypothetical protein
MTDTIKQAADTAVKGIESAVSAEISADKAALTTKLVKLKPYALVAAGSLGVGALLGHFL